MNMRLAALSVMVFFAVMLAFGQDKQATQVLALSSEVHYERARWFVNSLVVTKTTLYRITCRAQHNDCGTLTEGHTYRADIQGNSVMIHVENPATGKHLTVKFEVADSGPVQFVSARIADKKSNSSQYVYTVPGYSTSDCSGAAFGTATATSLGTTATGNVLGLGATHCSGVGASSYTVNYTVHGATLSLLLQDGRVVVVNCDSRPSPGSNQQRNCREPLTDEIQAEFDKDNARLMWNASVDGSAMGIETYKVIGILSKSPEPEQQK